MIPTERSSAASELLSDHDHNFKCRTRCPALSLCARIIDITPYNGIMFFGMAEGVLGAQPMRHLIAVIRFKIERYFGTDENYAKLVALYLGFGLGSVVGKMISTLA